jgi:hypothetical protein
MVSINYLRSRQHRENVPSSRRGCTEKKYRAVSIRPQLSSCRAVLALADTRFLAEEAPHFPVRGCNAKVCRCQYVYFPDRRDEQRRSPFGARHWAPTLGGERRGGERRQATS